MCLLAQHSLLMEEPEVHRELSRLSVFNGFHTRAHSGQILGCQLHSQTLGARHVECHPHPREQAAPK